RTAQCGVDLHLAFARCAGAKCRVVVDSRTGRGRISTIRFQQLGIDAIRAVGPAIRVGEVVDLLYGVRGFAVRGRAWLHTISKAVVDPCEEGPAKARHAWCSRPRRAQ